MSVEEEVANLTTATTDLLTAVNVAKATLDQAVSNAAAAAIVAGIMYPDEPTGRAAVQNGEFFKVLGSGPVAAYEYKRISVSSSELVTAYPSPYAVARNGYIVLGGLTYKYFDRSKGVWVISHDRLTIFRGSGTGVAGLVTIEAAANIEIPLNALYFANTTGITASTVITAETTTGDFSASGNGQGGFVDDLRIPLFGYRTYGIGGLLVDTPKNSINTWTAISAIWHKASNLTLSWNQTSRTLSWDGLIVCNNLFGGTRNALSISAGSFTVPSNGNYQVIWIDLRKISKDGTGTALDPADIFRCGAYGSYVSDFENAYVGAAYQLPVFIYNPWKSRPAPGFFEDQIVGCNYLADLSPVNSRVDATNADVLALTGRVLTLEENPSSGGATSPGNALQLTAGKIYETDATGSKLLSDPTPFQYLTQPQWRGKSVLTSMDKPSIGATSPVLVARDGTLIHPSADNLLTIVCSYGQSNSVGATAVPLDPITLQKPYPTTMLKLAGVDMRLGYSLANDVVIDLSGVNSFEPMISTENELGNGTTVCEGAMRYMGKTADQTLGFNPTYVSFAPGRGSTPLVDLTRGTTPYTNFMNGIAKVKQIAEAQGRHCWLPAVLWVAGEGDAANVNYATDLIALLDQIDEDVKAITGQVADVQFIVRQHSSFYSSVDGVLGLYYVTQQDPRFHLSSPAYFNQFNTDLLHDTSLGHFRQGEYMGKAYHHAVLGKGWKPVSPKTVTRVDANTLDIDMYVPVAPLVIDTVNGSAKNGAAQGFEITSNGTKTITNVQIIGGTKVRLTTAEAMGTTGNVRYAMAGQTSPRTVEGIPRGTLRDSDPTLSIITGTPNWNWCVHFRETF